MKQLLTSLCLTIAVLLGSAGVSWSDESNTEHSEFWEYHYNGTVSVWFKSKEQQEIMSFGNGSIFFEKEKFALNDIVVLNHRPQGNYFCADGIPVDYETLDRKGPFWDGPASKHDTFPFFADESPSIAIMYYYAGGTGWGWYDLYFLDTLSSRYVKFSNIPCGNFPEILVDGSRILSLSRDNTYLFGPRNFAMGYPSWFVVKDPHGKVSTELTAKINYERIVKDISFSDYDLTLLRKIGKAVESPDYDSKGISLFSEDEQDAVRESLGKFFQSLLYYNLSNKPFPEIDGDPALTALASKILNSHDIFKDKNTVE